MHLFTLTLLAATLAGCSLVPHYQRPSTPVPERYPQGPAYPTTAFTQAPEHWQTMFRDPALRQLIETALANNRDVRLALLNAEATRAQYRVQRAEQLPHVSLDASGQRQYLPRRMTGTDSGVISSTQAVTLGVSAYELDMFGRLRSSSEQALQTYLASEQARRAAQLSLVASVASVYLTWRADQELLALAEHTLAADEQSLRLTAGQVRVGTLSALDRIQAQTRVDSTRTAVARYRRLAAQDLNQLGVLVAGPVADDLPGLPLAHEQIAPVPAGMPSDLLQRRPDILQAEHQLQAANANIGAVRAALFPSISLTANAGTSSQALAGLFDAGSGTWLFKPQISLPLFNAGSLRANLDYAKLQKDIQVAQYQKAIQEAFQEVADGLAARATYQRQLQAQRDLVNASQRYHDLAQNRYRTGADSSLTFLDAQRQLFSAQQGLIGDRLAQLVAEVNLYAALGGGWDANPHL